MSFARMTSRSALLALALVILGTRWAAGARASEPIGAYTTRGAWSFVSAPGLHPPKLSADSGPARGDLAPGYFLVANFPNVAAAGPMTGQGGPLMLDDHLSPVWFASVGTDAVAADLQQETYQGKPVLLWWQGVVSRTGATRSGQVVVVDQHYRRIATLRARSPWVISLHDVAISDTGIWVTVYRYVRNQNLLPYHGSRHGTVYDVGVQEYDLKTGALLHTWDALNPGGHPNVALSESEQPPPSHSSDAWDAYHINSIQALPSGQLLVSMRNTWGVYLIDPVTARITWTLGGRASTFKVSPNARFAWQHDAEMLPGNEVTLFNDNCCKLLGGGKFATPNGQSQGMVLHLDTNRLTATLVASYAHRPARYVAFLGSTQRLDDGNAVVGWGSLPFFSEFSASGKLLLDAMWPGKDQSYRAGFTGSWVGTPSYPPSGAARIGRSSTTVYASWNGATKVATWLVLAGRTSGQLSAVSAAPRNGFETAIGLRGTSYKYFQVRALDAERHVLDTSKTFTER
jgi:hypothetical protein